MSGKTKIEWANKVWNPIVGCTPVSDGCRNCYAKRIYERFHPGSKFSNIYLAEEKLEDPLRWSKNPVKIFVNSMSDLFHPDVPDEWINQVLYITSCCESEKNIFLILTKRPKRMMEFMLVFDKNKNLAPGSSKDLGNVWFGVSIEDQKTADDRIPLLLQTPAAKRFLSVEPMLGPVNLEPYLQYPPFHENYKMTFGLQEAIGLDWVICGGESGPCARPLHPDWARSLRDQCVESGVPFFFKQWGEWTTQPGNVDLSNRKQTFSGNYVFSRVGKKNAGRLLDGKVWDQIPEDRK